MRTLPLPEPLLRSLSQLEAQAAQLMAAQNWEAAEKCLAEHYKLMFDSQPADGRFHKGFPLHNLAGCAFWMNHQDRARRFWIAALVEDVLTHDLQPWATLPAATNLRNLNGIPDVLLGLTAKRILEAAESGRVDSRDPFAIIKALDLDRPFDLEVVPTLERRARKAGEYGTPWEKRVFVGASYQAGLAFASEIIKVCRAAGFDPVAEYEFDIPPGEIHHHALMLLHDCRLAIFEVSHPAGQLMELERARDYGIKPLVLYQGTIRVSVTSRRWWQRSWHGMT